MPQSKAMSRRLLRLAILYVTILYTCQAQNTKSGPEFEVASIKPAPPRIPFSAGLGLLHSRTDDLRFERSNVTLIALISTAYGINSDRISGPGWMSEQEFAIAAKLPTGSTKEEVPAMLQSLLADRFKLSAHRDQKVEPVYELVIDRQSIDKQGVKLKPSTADEPARGCSSRPGQCVCQAVTLGRFAGFLGSTAKMAARMAAMPQPEELVEHRIDRPVMDQTGLTGLYDIDLEWVPPAGLPAPIPGAGDGFPTRDRATKTNSVFGALEAVGLKLQAARHTFDALVVDRVERLPSEN